jgi:hypothetical protein
MFYRVRTINFGLANDVKYYGRDIEAAREAGRKVGFECVLERSKLEYGPHLWEPIEAYSPISGSWRKIF